MTHYTLAIGTHDPEPVNADSDAEAIQRAVDMVRDRYGEELRGNPQEVASLIGPAGLITRPAERIDEFVVRATGANPAGAPDEVQPGDSNTPDCNGD